jgi:drug/metabolite transporter (DMT)-like permease
MSRRRFDQLCTVVAAAVAVVGAWYFARQGFAAIEWVGGFVVLLAVVLLGVVALGRVVVRCNGREGEAGDEPSLDPVSHVIVVVVSLGGAGYAASHQFTAGQYAVTFVVGVFALAVVLFALDFLRRKRPAKRGDAGREPR